MVHPRRYFMVCFTANEWSFVEMVGARYADLAAAGFVRDLTPAAVARTIRLAVGCIRTGKWRGLQAAPAAA